MGNHKEVVCKTTQCDLGNYEYAEVMPIADLHIGDPTFNKKLVDSVVKWVNAEPYRYLVIAGDVFNAGLKDSVSSVYSETMNLQKATEYFKEFVGLVGKENILAVVRGNHDNRVVKSVGLDPVAVACELTDITYCGAEGYITLSVGDWKTKTDRRSPIKYLMYLTHGVGGGRTPGSSVNAVVRHTDIVVADVYIQGHSHRPSITPGVVYVTDSRCESIVEKDQLFVITSSFIGRDGYAKDFCFAPLSGMFPVIRLSGKRKMLGADLIRL